MNKKDHIMTSPKKGLKTRPYNMDMSKEDHIMTLPQKGLKTKPYNMDMNKEDHIATLPRKGSKTKPYNMDMNKEDLTKLTKGQLIKLLLKQKKSKKVSNHEDLLDNDPFKDEVAQEPAKPPIPQVEENITDVPVPKIKELKRALKNHTKSYEIELQDNLNPLNHFTKTRPLIESHLEDLLKP